MTDAVRTLFKVVLGLILILVPIYVALTYSGWGRATISFIQGGIIIFVILIGLIIVLLGLSELK